MSIEMDPVGLVELGGVFSAVFRVEMIVGGGDESRIVDSGLLIDLLSGERVASGFLFVDIAVGFLLVSADFLVVLFELLSRCEAWQEWEI